MDLSTDEHEHNNPLALELEESSIPILVSDSLVDANKGIYIQ